MSDKSEDELNALYLQFLEATGRTKEDFELFTQRQHEGLEMLDAPAAVVRARGLDDLLEKEMFEAIPRIKEVLADDAPLVGQRAQERLVFELRQHALVVLQDLYRRGTIAPDFGPIQVRKGMPESEVRSAAERALAGLPPDEREALFARVDAYLAARVQPPPQDRDLVRAYRVLQELGLVEYATQEVDPVTLITPLQEEIYASQVKTPRPAPNLRVASRTLPGSTLGWYYRNAKGTWVEDFSDHPYAAQATDKIAWLRRAARGGVPRVAFDKTGQPRRNQDGSFVIKGDLPSTTKDVEAYLRSLAAFLESEFVVDVTL